MFAPPSWGLARQEHARSPTIRHCKWDFISSFSCQTSIKRCHGGSKQERNDVPSTSTAVVLDLSRNKSCIDLSRDAQPSECSATGLTLSASSEIDSESSDREDIEQVTSNLEPDKGPSNTSLPASTTSVVLEQGQLARAKISPGRPTSAISTACILKLPPPKEAPLCVYRKGKTLEFDKHGEPYFKISKGPINISSLPSEEQKAAYSHALTKAVPTSALESGPSGIHAEEILGHCRLHLTRLAFARGTIQDLALEHRTSGKLLHHHTMSSWSSGALWGKEKAAANTHLATASSASRKRVVEKGEERGITVLLDRCEGILKLDPKFESVPWRSQSPLPRKRWKNEERGWMGLQSDDTIAQIAGAGRKMDEENSAQKAKAAFKEAFTRAANKACGKKRRQRSVFLGVKPSN